MIGLLAYQGLTNLITAVSGPLFLYIAGGPSRSVLGYEKAKLPWDRLLSNIVQAALALALAYVMLRWLYGTKSEAAEEPAAESAE